MDQCNGVETSDRKHETGIPITLKAQSLVLTGAVDEATKKQWNKTIFTLFYRKAQH